MNLSEIFYCTIEEFVLNFENKHFNFCPSDLYVRSHRTEASIQKKKDALIFKKDSQEFVKVLEPLVFFQLRENFYCLSGNHRSEALIEIYKSGKFYEYHLIPYRICDQISIYDVLNFQLKTNDTTDSHTLLEIADLANKVYQWKFGEYQEIGFSLEESAKSALNSTSEELQRSKKQIQELMQISRSDPYLRSLISSEVISFSASIEFLQTVQLNKYSETVENLLKSIVQFVKKERPFFNLKITKNDIKKFFIGYKPLNFSTVEQFEKTCIGTNQNSVLTVQENLLFSLSRIDSEKLKKSNYKTIIKIIQGLSFLLEEIPEEYLSEIFPQLQEIFLILLKLKDLNSLTPEVLRSYYNKINKVTHLTWLICHLQNEDMQLNKISVSRVGVEIRGSVN